MDDYKLYIPYGAKIEKEYILGFGKRETKHCVIGWLIVFICTFGVYSITLNVFPTLLVLFVGMASSIILARRAVYGQSAIGVLQSLIRFITAQKIFRFVYGKNFESDKEGEECQIPLPPPRKRDRRQQAAEQQSP